MTATAAPAGGVPVTIITGHLGAGKTTLLNNLLAFNRQQASPLRVVVIENEFAMEFGVEEQLLLSHARPSGTEEVREIFEFGTGCMCCSSFGQFVATLLSVAASIKEVDHVLVETTGLAGGGPDGTGWAPVFQQPALAQHFRLQNVVAVVDAVNFMCTVRDPDRPAAARNEAAEQVGIASVVLLNKLDLVGDEVLIYEILQELRALNPHLHHIHQSIHADVDALALLGPRRTSPVPSPKPAGSVTHDTSVKVHCLVKDAAFDHAAITAWVSHVVSRTEGVLRLKAVIPISGFPDRLILQGVRSRVDATWGAPWMEDEPRTAKVVVIGRHLDVDALRNGFDALTEKCC
eukprot:GGOE01043437.1.p1 GENE.GGOE01043437.1~~GGOE01043437.1.p1  ORF type:complete len:347 (-),score=93.48 GGOE01043437.1:136-1176(-)